MLTFYVDSEPVHCSWDPQTSFFSNFFIKNRSHGTIHTFKNYFATVFSVFSFQLYPNGSFSNNSFFSILLCFLSSPFFFIFFLLPLGIFFLLMSLVPKTKSLSVFFFFFFFFFNKVVYHQAMGDTSPSP